MLEAGLRALATSGAVGFCVFTMRDDGTEITHADDTFIAMIGHTRESFDRAAPLEWRTLTPADGLHALEERLLMLAESGMHGPREQELLTRNGDHVPVLVTSAWTDRDSGQAVSLCVDVTEQVRARIDAERASQSKSRFLSVITHELRTPLNTIVGQTELIADGTYGPVSDRQLDALARLKRASQQLRALVDDVLTFSRIEMGSVEYDVSAIPLGDSLAAVIEGIRAQAVAKAIDVHVEPPARGIQVFADVGKLRQVMLVLLANAVKFTPSGGTVRVDTPMRGDIPDFVFVRVTDSGSGIARARQDAIFEPFTQMDEGRVRTSTGLGLGLSIGRDLARGMGGDVRVRSAPGGGSTFTLSIRRAPDAPLKSPTDRAET